MTPTDEESKIRVWLGEPGTWDSVRRDDTPTEKGDTPIGRAVEALRGVFGRQPVGGGLPRQQMGEKPPASRATPRTKLWVVLLSAPLLTYFGFLRLLPSRKSVYAFLRGVGSVVEIAPTFPPPAFPKRRDPARVLMESAWLLTRQWVAASARVHARLNIDLTLAIEPKAEVVA